MSLRIVKKAFVILLLMVATLSQPVLAIPASCQMPGKCPAVTCAGCCAENPCCAASDRQQSSPVNALSAATVPFLAAVIFEAVAVPLPTVRHIEFPQFTRTLGDAHAPPPLALNCIQLI